MKYGVREQLHRTNADKAQRFHIAMMLRLHQLQAGDAIHLGNPVDDAITMMATWLEQQPSLNRSLGDQLKDGTDRQDHKPYELVPELRSHLPSELADVVVDRVVGDLGVLQGTGCSPSLEHDVRSGEHLQHDADLVEVDHGRECISSRSDPDPQIFPQQ